MAINFAVAERAKKAIKTNESAINISVWASECVN